MIITTGGVSVGKKDIMHESLRLMGGRADFLEGKDETRNAYTVFCI